MLLFCDSFDHYNSPGLKWDSAVNASISVGAGRNGSAALYLSNAGNVNYYVTKNVGTPSTLYVGFAVNVSFEANVPDYILVALQDGGTTQVDLRVTATGNFYFTRNGTQIGQLTAQSLPGGAWHYIEIGVTISSTAGIAILRVDGVNWINLTAQNTQATSDSFATGVVVGSRGNLIGAPVVTVDDLYIANSATPSPNGFLGDTYVVAALPSGNGSTQQFTSGGAAWAASTAYALGAKIVDSGGYIQKVTTAGTSGTSAPSWNETVGGTTTDGGVTWTNQGKSAYQFVNENPSNDGQTLLSNSTVGDEELFTFPAVVQPGNVAAVVVWPRTSGSGTVRGVALSGTATGDNGSDIAVTTNYAYGFAPIVTDPNTGSPWTLAGVNAAQFGAKQTG